MSNTLGLAGAQPQAPTRFAPIYTGRWSSGLWTNRSPLRDATTTRLTEKFYGAAGDALIAGSNVEITNRLTLARRPGNSAFDGNSYSSVDRFYDFRLFSATDEQIRVMVDQATALYSLYQGTKTLVWTKQSGSGQSYMQSVGNSLYWGDGVSNKKWLQSLTTWSANTQWNTSSTPFLTTFLIDPNGNIQQLAATVVPVTKVEVSNNILTITSSVSNLSPVLSVGMYMSFPGVMDASFLENETVTITSVTGNKFTAAFQYSTGSGTYSGAEKNVVATETTGGSNPISGSTQPVWSTVVPSASNLFKGGVTTDGMIQWINRGSPVQNWGIQAPTTALQPTLGTSNVSWQKGTYYSLPGVVIDTNGNLQQVSVSGKSGATMPLWSTGLNTTTVDGGVTWTMIQTAASLVWQPGTNYTPSRAFSLTSVSASVGGSSTYSGAVTGGVSNAYAGMYFVLTGWTNIVNNGVYLCSASTATTLTLTNANAVAETNAGTATTRGTYVIGNAYGTNCLYEIAPKTQPSLTGNVSAYLYPGPTSGAVGCFILTNPTTTGSASASNTSLNSLQFGGVPGSGGGPIYWGTVDSSGQQTGTTVPFPGYGANFQLVILASLSVPVAGTYTFSIQHHDGMIWGIGNGATLVSGTSDNPIKQTVTAAEGYAIFGGTNRGLEGGQQWNDTFTVHFPTAGTYPVEIDYSYWYHSGLDLIVQCNGFPLANSSAASGTSTSGSQVPIWPAWATTYAPNYPTVTEANGQITWENLGPVTDFAWSAGTNFTLPNTGIIDPNGYSELPYRTGVTGTTVPTFATGVNALTLDNPNLTWINQGTTTAAPTGTLSVYNGGWRYGVALVNTLDNTVSNMTPISSATGNFVGIGGVSLAPGEGLPPLSGIDPQADYVAIFRSTDGQAVPFLIPGESSIYTVPLSEYLLNGYIDNTPDTGLDNLLSGAVSGQNTPPAAGAQNLAFHLNRLFYSIGNTVYWTAGADTPVGNGVSGTPPLNFDTFPSLVKRIVPTATGAIVFTVSDVYVIQGSATASSPIQSAIPIMQGVGLLNYNALDVNGSIIGFFTTDRQFCIIDPSSGNSYAGFPIGDQFRKSNGTPGQNWNPANVYVTWHVEGEDQGWYVSDGSFGWYRLIPTPAPEQGYTWSPFATISGGCKAVQSIEVQPGVHKLLLGPTNTGPLLARDLSTFQDNGQNYTANATIGSAVLAQPGQVATVSFITTESVRVGTPLTIGVIFDEALPYYTGPFDILKVWENDPPGLKQSRSFYAQRFYLSEARDEAACRHMQILVQWAAENAANELTSLTVFGGYFQEK